MQFSETLWQLTMRAIPLVLTRWKWTRWRSSSPSSSKVLRYLKRASLILSLDRIKPKRVIRSSPNSLSTLSILQSKAWRSKLPTSLNRYSIVITTLGKLTGTTTAPSTMKCWLSSCHSLRLSGRFLRNTHKRRLLKTPPIPSSEALNIPLIWCSRSWIASCPSTSFHFQSSSGSTK